MLDKLVVVDYHEGAGGEFLANVISAHWGHELVFDQQRDPNFLQKWLNSHSITCQDWAENFSRYLDKFIRLCISKGVKSIAVPYHLYKWPSHADTIRQTMPNVRFVKIDTVGFEPEIQADFERKILDRTFSPEDFDELVFLLKNLSSETQQHYLDLFRQKKLSYRIFFSNHSGRAKKILPTQDIVVYYRDFFMQADTIPGAYQQLCNELGLDQEPMILDQILRRNAVNRRQQQLWMETQ